MSFKRIALGFIDGYKSAICANRVAMAIQRISTKMRNSIDSRLIRSRFATRIAIEVMAVWLLYLQEFLGVRLN